MVHAQTVEPAAFNPFTNERMNVIKNLLVLDANGGERADGEKTAVIQFQIAVAPGCQPIILLLNQFVERGAIGIQLFDRNIFRNGIWRKLEIYFQNNAK